MWLSAWFLAFGTWQHYGVDVAFSANGGLGAFVVTAGVLGGVRKNFESKCHKAAAVQFGGSVCQWCVSKCNRMTFLSSFLEVRCLCRPFFEGRAKNGCNLSDFSFHGRNRL